MTEPCPVCGAPLEIVADLDYFGSMPEPAPTVFRTISCRAGHRFAFSFDDEVGARLEDGSSK